MLPRTLKKPGRGVRSFASCAMLTVVVAAKLSSKIAAINTEYFLSFIAAYLSVVAILASSSAHVKQRRITARRFSRCQRQLMTKMSREMLKSRKKYLTGFSELTITDDSSGL